MAVLDILTWPDERLKQVSQPVTEFDEALARFIDDLEETRLAGPGAVGIAAPQVGRFIRVVIVDVSKTRKPVPNHGHLVLVNPEITEWEGYELGREGCLSVPDYTGNVIRAERIHLRAQDAEGNWREWDMEGFEARAVQHEIDHLDGLLFLDRVVSRRSDIFRRKVYKKKGQP
ncbi:MAG: peptide deformylase [Gammaproteobacteria bacterium]|nr:MAG: peptide deformylase [Gammaproteobacteria bacterium]